MSDNQSKTEGLDPSAKHVFWASYFGWLLDGYDTTIYAFVVGASLAFLLPHSGIVTSDPLAYGLEFFAIFLAGWGTAFVFGPLADKVGRMKTLGIAILLYALGTFFSGLSYNVFEFGIARFVTGFGLGAEWFIGGTGVSEVFPEKSRDIWAGRFHSAWYAGFIVAAVTTPLILRVLPYTYDWRIIFFIGILPAAVLGYIRVKSTEPELWQKKKEKFGDKMNLSTSFRIMFSPAYRRKTIMLVLVMIPVITGLYGGTLFAPSTVANLVKSTPSIATGNQFLWEMLGGVIIAGFTLIFSILMPYMVRRMGRKTTLTIFMLLMIAGLVTAFGFVYKGGSGDLFMFLPLLALLGIGGADFSVFSLWVPEVYPTEARAGGFAVITTLGRYAGAGLVFVISYMASRVGLGHALAYGSIAFVIGIVILSFVREDRHKTLDRNVEELALEA